MARPLRIEYHGALYHVISRGDHREAIYWDNRDRADFLNTLAALAPLRWREIDLASHPKGHRFKVRIAHQLRQQTPMTYQWIANCLPHG